MEFPYKLAARWQRLNLAAQFALVATIVVLIAMGVIGAWVSSRIQKAVTQNSSASTALFMDSFVAPLVQELKGSNVLSSRTHKDLDALLQDTALGKRVKTIKIWGKGRVILYSNETSLIGRSFPATDSLRNAWRGVVSAEFDDLDDEEDALERASGLPLLEMYVPIRADNSDKIIAVGEFYFIVPQLKADLAKATVQSWLMVGGVSLAMLTLLSSIVARGSRTIESQRSSLQKQIHQLSDLLSQNQTLRRRVEQAYRRTGEINEQFMGRVSADLHDGPAQLIGFALLRLDALKQHSKKGEDDEVAKTVAEDFESVRCALTETLSEIRQLSTELRLPQIQNISAAETIRLAVSNHERRTRTNVTTSIFDKIHRDVPHPIKVCLFRCTQEGLNNAFKHAQGHGQRVIFNSDKNRFKLEVCDAGEGFEQTETGGRRNGQSGGIGLLGLKDRVESLGGNLELTSIAGKGSNLIVSFDTDKLEHRADD